jgi:DNA-3-methyladenine glycosylase
MNDTPSGHGASDAAPDASLLLPAEFFARDPATVARDLLGCVLVSEVDCQVAGGMIVETEAYLGADDPGSHAATRGMTARNAVMFGPPGVAYVYFTYGNHHMINLVCDANGTAGAVLVRAIVPQLGVDVMTSRRRGRSLRELCNGPGKLAQALAIDLNDNRRPLGDGRLSVYHGALPQDATVATSGRVGLSTGWELQLRYFVDREPFVSKGRTGPPPQRRTAT